MHAWGDLFIMSRIAQLWHRILHWLIRWIYFDRVRLIHPERLPDLECGPILFVSLHRNGGTDGLVLRGVFPKITFLISRQLRRGFLARMFFCGIEAIRDRDHAEGEGSRRDANRVALEACHLHLTEGGQLAIFPEGTSSLGPRHLPFKSGAARILHRFLEEHPGRPITVVPLGFHYERAWAFRSRLEILVSAPVRTDLSPAISSRQRLNELKARLHDALEGVAAEFPSQEAQQRGEALAYAATLGTKTTYTRALRRFADHVPSRLGAAWDAIDEEARKEKLWRHQGVPLFPLKRIHLLPYLLYFLLIAPFVALATLLNAPVLLPAYGIARRKADDHNVIALIRIMAGFSLAPFWIGLVAIAAALLATPSLFLAYLAVSALGLLGTYRFRKLAVIIRNGLCAPHFGVGVRRFHRLLLDQISHEHYPRNASREPVVSS